MPSRPVIPRARLPRRKSQFGPPTIDEQVGKVTEVVNNVYAATGSGRKTADLTGLSRPTVDSILKHDPNALLSAEKQHQTRLLTFAADCLGIADSKKHTANFMQAVTAQAIAVDKYVALSTKGQPAIAIQVNALSASVDLLQSLRDKLSVAPSQPTNGIDLPQDKPDEIISSS